MIDSTLYDYLENIVKEQEIILQKYQNIYGNKENARKRIGINTVQSIIRRAVIDEQKDIPAYAWIRHGKKSYESVKLKNYKFDFDFIIYLLGSVKSIIDSDKWAIIMVILTIFSQLRKCKIEMSPAMAIIAMFLHDNGYERKMENSITEDELKDRVLPEIIENIEGSNANVEFKKAIKGLEDLKAITIQDGNISLIEKIKI